MPTKCPPPTWLRKRHGRLEMFAGDDGKGEVEKEDVEGDDSELRAEEGRTWGRRRRRKLRGKLEGCGFGFYPIKRGLKKIIL